MPIEKQSLNNFLPDGFETLNQEGYKENFSEDKITTGYEKDVPDIVSGPNLNNLIDVVGKNTNTLNNYVEYLNGMPINNVPTVNVNGQLDYMNLDDKLTKKRLTNCILEIPQRIKYTLENGTLTIKAGSVVIVPYGVEDLRSQYPKGSTFIHENFKVYDTQFEEGKFFVWAELVNDIVRNETWSGNGSGFIFLNLENGNDLYFEFAYQTSSGSDFSSTTPYNTRYNTTGNLIKRRIKTGETWLGLRALPLLQIIFNNGYESVKQVFNGIGYIGSTYWVDKGVKCLIPNGRNADGTLKNIEYINEKLCMETISATWSAISMLFLSPNYNTGIFRQIASVYYEQEEEPPIDGVQNTLWYKPSENIFRYSNNQSSWAYINMPTCYLGDFYVEKGILTSLKPKETFRALDYNDKYIISGFNMPSNKHIDLTLGASKSRYVAPANGWFYVTKTTGVSTHTYLDLVNETSTLAWRSNSSGSVSTVSAIYIPVKKGDTVRCSYNLTGETTGFRFIYAEGEI